MAHIIDIRTIGSDNVIPNNETFAIDTNVLVWTHYSKASNPNLRNHPYQVIEYPDFVAKLISNGNKIVTTVLNLTELCGVVERDEYEIYKAINNSKSTFKLKSFRKNPTARLEYKNEIDNMIMEIREIYDDQIKVVEINDDLIDCFRENISNNRCDVFDYAVIEYLKSIGIYNYVSDDKDFSTIDGINLYTTSMR